MNVLVIYAHPDTKGHNTVILSEVEKSLKREKADYKVLDLYKMKYDPILHEKEHYTAGNYHVSPQNRKIQKLIKWSDKLVFIYPVWWFSMPAILKGFFDKVLVSRFAFRYYGKIPVGLLAHKQAMVFFTTGGPKTYYLLTGRTPRNVIKKTLEFAGIRTSICQFGNCLKLDQRKKDRIRKVVRRKMKKWLAR